MRNILFLGNYFSHARGTKPVMERVAGRLSQDGFQIQLASRRSFWLWRLLDLWRAIYMTSYDLAFIDVFSDRSFMMAEWAAFWIRIRNKKYILTLRGGKLTEFAAGKNRRIEKLFSQAHRIQTPSLFLQDYFSKMKFEIRYLPNPVDLANFEFVPRPAVSRFKVLWVRAFTEVYNPDAAVRMMKTLAADFPESTLTMVGPDMGLLQNVRNLIGELGLSERIEIAGHVPNEKLPFYYQSHDVYINTTSYESFGVAVVEAASCGIPIVSYNVGEIPYLWTDRENILLCAEGDIEGMASRVSEIFRDNGLAGNLSVKARKKAEAFSWLRIKQLWVDLLKENGVANTD